MLEANACTICGQPTRLANSYLTIGKTFHKTCFTCRTCGIQLNLRNFIEHDGDIFCTNHGATNNLGSEVVPFWNNGATTGSQLTCSICMLEYNDNNVAVVLACGHSFHRECLRKWVNPECPICRAAIIEPFDSLKTNYALMELLSEIKSDSGLIKQSSMPSMPSMHSAELEKASSNAFHNRISELDRQQAAFREQLEASVAEMKRSIDDESKILLGLIDKKMAHAREEVASDNNRVQNILTTPAPVAPTPTHASAVLSSIYSTLFNKTIQSPSGRHEFCTTGTYEWKVPAGVKSISAIVIGGGGGGGNSTSRSRGGYGGITCAMEGNGGTSRIGEITCAMGGLVGGSKEGGLGGLGNLKNGATGECRIGIGGNGGAAGAFGRGYAGSGGQLVSGSPTPPSLYGGGGAGIESGGGGGGYSILKDFPVKPGTVIPITVGSGGTSSSNSSKGASGIVVIAWGEEIP